MPDTSAKAYSYNCWRVHRFRRADLDAFFENAPASWILSEGIFTGIRREEDPEVSRSSYGRIRAARAAHSCFAVVDVSSNCWRCNTEDRVRRAPSRGIPMGNQTKRMCFAFLMTTKIRRLLLFGSPGNMKEPSF